jgi:hypothetical protein
MRPHRAVNGDRFSPKLKTVNPRRVTANPNKKTRAGVSLVEEGKKNFAKSSPHLTIISIVAKTSNGKTNGTVASPIRRHTHRKMETITLSKRPAEEGSNVASRRIGTISRGTTKKVQ